MNQEIDYTKTIEGHHRNFLELISKTREKLASIGITLEHAKNPSQTSSQRFEIEQNIIEVRNLLDDSITDLRFCFRLLDAFSSSLRKRYDESLPSD